MSRRRPRTGWRPTTSKEEPPTTRGRAEADEGKSDGGKIAERGKGLDASAQVLEFGHGKRGVIDSEAGGALADVDEAFLITIDEWAQEDAANQGDDGGVSSNTEGEGEHHGDGQAFGAGEGTKRELEVVEEIHAMP